MIKFTKDWPLKKTIATPTSPELSGLRVVLRRPHITDYAAWAQARAKNQSFLTPYEPAWAEDCLTQNFFKRRLMRQDKEIAEGRGLFFLIHHKISGDIIGGLNLNNIQWGAARQGSLGYWIDADYQAQGYMKESIALLVDYAFQTLKLKRLNAACLPSNDRSIGLLMSLGFEKEGYAKKYLQINGAWQDHILFGLTSPRP